MKSKIQPKTQCFGCHVFLAIHFGEKNLLTFLAAKDDKRNAWWLPSVFVKGYWAQTCLIVVKCFFAQILGVDIPSNHKAFFHRDIKRKDTY
jgi:hypothetical protein